MSDIPKERLANNCKPFSHTAVDSFGPINVKLSRKTKANSATEKRYGALFTCLATKTIHIKVCNDLSTDSFNLALRRFKTRTGQVKSIHCDNGTNFKGAGRELKQACSRLDKNSIKKYLLESLIEWKFDPPSSPWIGGICESLVKSIKRALKSTIKDCLFTKEVLYTTLCEVKLLLNNRPLTNINDDVNDC